MQNSPNQQDPDQDQRKNSSVEDSCSMTIEFLRARLLSERSLSRTARQRADELAKRVLELEQELKVVSLQRKKAEKAATAVLAILENNGINEFSDEFDSTSDQEMIHPESKSGHNSQEEEEISVCSKMRKNHTDEFSSSELQSSPLPGRSLPWKGEKDSSHFREKKYMDSPTRRRSSSVSTASSSSRHRIGKSCRQIRRRETRSAVVESQSDHTMLAPQQNGAATFSEGFSIHSATGSEIMREVSERDANIFLGDRVLEDLENLRPYLNARGNGEDMERALAHQARLIGQYETEEEAQREWEEKFRENDTNTPDSCGPGNPSDVTEEIGEPREDSPPQQVGTTVSQDQEAKSKDENICVTKESSEGQPNGFQSPPQVDLRSFQDQKSQPSDFEFPMCTGNQNQQSSVGNHSVPLIHSNVHNLSHSESPTGYQSANIFPSQRNINHYALVPHITPDSVGSVLEALHQAKLSLKQKANMALRPDGLSLGDRRPEVPVGCPGLFRVPYDFHLDAAAKSNFPGSNSRMGFINQYPESGNTLTAVDRSSIPFIDSHSNVFTGGRNFSTPTSLYPEGRLKKLSWEMPETFSRFSHANPFFGRSLCTSLPLSRTYAYNDPNTGGADLVSSSTFTSPVYPFHPDLMPRIPSEERQRRLFSSTGSGIPPSSGFPFCEDNIRPNNVSSSMYTSPVAYPYPDLMPKIPSDEGKRLFSSTGTGFSPPNRLPFDNDHFRPNMYR